MARVACVRCGETREAAGRVLPGALGDEIERGICAECWKEWLQAQIRVINHYGLRPALREDREKLYEFTRQYLGLPGQPAGDRT
ncbi:MAG: Fe(2+)-trafficking protein [Chloroflexota bacterium]|nr:Fe(2+)-trafficking protein [Chloroflexota bacterium]MDE3192923.1 Fe(2+)-trafficking protein [Chloroflexota bacterium]